MQPNGLCYTVQGLMSSDVSDVWSIWSLPLRAIACSRVSFKIVSLVDLENL